MATFLFPPPGIVAGGRQHIVAFTVFALVIIYACYLGFLRSPFVRLRVRTRAALSLAALGVAACAFFLYNDRLLRWTASCPDRYRTRLVIGHRLLPQAEKVLADLHVSNQSADDTLNWAGCRVENAWDTSQVPFRWRILTALYFATALMAALAILLAIEAAYG